MACTSVPTGRSAVDLLEEMGFVLGLERSPGTRHMETYLYQLGMRARGTSHSCIQSGLCAATEYQTDLQTDALLDGSTQIFSECKGQGGVDIKSLAVPV